MKYKQIYDHALAILRETPNSAGNEDYLARAPVLLAGIVAGYSQVSEALNTGSGGIPTDPVLLTDDFPLDSRLALPSAMTLASQFVFDESAEQAELLRVKAKEIVGGIAADVGNIREAYR